MNYNTGLLPKLLKINAEKAEIQIENSYKIAPSISTAITPPQKNPSRDMPKEWEDLLPLSDFLQTFVFLNENLSKKYLRKKRRGEVQSEKNE